MFWDHPFLFTRSSHCSNLLGTDYHSSFKRSGKNNTPKDEGAKYFCMWLTRTFLWKPFKEKKIKVFPLQGQYWALVRMPQTNTTFINITRIICSQCLADTMQAELQWASELPGDGHCHSWLRWVSSGKTQPQRLCFRIASCYSCAFSCLPLSHSSCIWLGVSGDLETLAAYSLLWLVPGW